MARYTGPATKIARTFGEAIFGYDKAFEKRKYAPGQHGLARKRKQRSNYAIQLAEKQKAKHTYGVLERQFRNTFHDAHSKSGVTGEILLQLLEARLDNVVYRMGLTKTRRAARQMVSHKHILVNGILTNIPSCRLRPGDKISVRGKSQNLPMILVGNKDVKKFVSLEWNPDKMEGLFITYPTREQIPENINEQFIVELYSK